MRFFTYLASFALVFFYQFVLQNCQFYSQPNFFKPRFIYGTTNGIYLAVVFPIDLPGRETYLGWFFEAIYTLASNESQYDYPPLLERRMDKIDRTYVYNVVENNLKSKGFPGKACLLRTICEMAFYSIEHSSGIIGDILHILLSPSTSKNWDLPLEYLTAELSGRENNCEKFSKNCTVSFVDLFSKFLP